MNCFGLGAPKRNFDIFSGLSLQSLRRSFASRGVGCAALAWLRGCWIYVLVFALLRLVEREAVRLLIDAYAEML